MTIDPRQVRATAFTAGDLVSERFRIIRLLGKGGMGEVYEAEDLVLHRQHVALKTLPLILASEERAVERLKREIALARHVTHPNVCRVFDVDRHRTASGELITFFTMELLNGETLAQRLRERGTLTTAEALPLIRQIAAALGAAHAAGIVHGDLKPGNLMLAPSTDATGGERLVVTDFGLAHPASMGATNAATMTGSPGWGTPAYMPPEQIAGAKLAPQADVFALGAVVQEMVSGSPIHALVPIDPRWRAAIDTCLQRDPAERFKTADEFVRALEKTTTRASAMRWALVAAGVGGIGLTLLLLPFAKTALTSRRATSAATVAGIDRSVAVLPFEATGETAEATAFGRGLAVILAEQLRLAAPAERVGQRLRAVPSAELMDAGLLTPAGVHRTLRVNLVVTGRIARNDQGTVITMNVDETSAEGRITRQRSRTFGAVGGNRLLVPAALADVTDVLGTTISPATVQRVAQGGTTLPEAENFYIRGRGYLSASANIDAAIEALQRAIEADRGFALAQAALSDAYRLKYKASRDGTFIEQAQRAGDKAIALNPSATYAHVIRGFVYADTGQHERAIRELQMALQADPDALDARQGLADAYEAEGFLAKAEENYRQEIASYPQYWLPYVNFGSYLTRRGRYREAEANLLSGVQYAPDNARAIGNLAGLYILTDRFAAAETELQRGLELSPSVIAYNNLAWVHIFQEHFEKAVPLLEQAVKLPRADSLHWGNLARVYRWTNQRRQANATYQIAIQIAEKELAVNPRDARIRANWACLLAETGRRREALAEIATTLERAPTDVSVIFRSALVYELTGDRTGALDALKAAARGGHSRADIHRHPDLAHLREDPRYLEILTLAPRSALQ